MKNYHLKKIASAEFAKAVKTGVVTRENQCSGCGGKPRANGIKRIVAHHEDYAKPLDVIYYCDSCHKKRHGQINKGLPAKERDPLPPSRHSRISPIRPERPNVICLLFSNYVKSSDRSLSKIAASIGLSRPTCAHWISRDSAVYVEIQPDRFEDIISVDKAVNYYKRDEK